MGDQVLGMRRDSAGFVLIELIVVVALIGLIAAVVFPALLPAIAFSQIEGAARHLTGYGRSAMAHCALMGERITVKIDLDAQEYWCVRWPKPEVELGGERRSDQTLDEEEDEFLDLGLFGDDLAELDETALEEKALRMQDSFDRFARMALMARARNARRESIMDEFGPLFEREFTLDIEEEEEEEIVLPLLNRTKMPEEVQIESVVVGGTDYTKGVVEVDLSPLGLLEPVVFFVKDLDEEYFTVEWDPITGLTYLYEGKESLT